LRFIFCFSFSTLKTLGAYFAVHQERVNGKTYNLALWDTAGEEKFANLTNFYCRGAKAAIVVYDVTQHQTFVDAKKWIQKLLDVDPVFVLAGNKCCAFLIQ
jgi:small GTP-binding protein